jgi:hypothetical protein
MDAGYRHHQIVVTAAATSTPLISTQLAPGEGK